MTDRALDRVRDGMVVIGCLLVAVGAGLAWYPAGFMVGGALLATGGIIGSMRGSRGGGA